MASKFSGWKDHLKFFLEYAQMLRVRTELFQSAVPWVFRDTRLPVATVIENLEDLSVDEEFDVTREQISAVLEFVAQSLKTPIPPQTLRPALK